MKKSIFTISTFMLLAASTVAQQEKLLTHFIYDKMSINPGSTGLDQGIGATMIYRNQWDKVNGAPNSLLFNLEGNLDRVFTGGAGISFYHDAIGEMKQNNLLLNYSLHVPLQIGGEHQGILGAGVGLGLVNVGFDPQWVPPVTPDDPLLPLATSGGALDLNFGLFWRGNKNAMRPYYVGVSATHLTQAQIKNVNYSNARHMFLIGGYTMFDVLGEGKSLDFQMLARTDMVKYSAEINARYLHTLNAQRNTQVYGGITYRVSDGAGLMLGYVQGPLTVGYSYDMTLNKLRDISKGSHEIVLRYIKLIPPPPVQKAKHPRWL
jgi:type IX secretion system PorP/SprF family membrane protein